MAIDVKEGKKSHESGGTQAGETATVVEPRATPVNPHGPPPLFSTPVILERKKKGRNKRRYTSGTKGLQRLTLGVAKAAYRSANAFAEGLQTFSKRSNRSARRRRDGLIRDSLRNASSGFADGLNELGRAPREVTRKISGRAIWRTFRIFTLS
jgi:hypothetical protein